MQSREECPDPDTICANVSLPPGATVEYKCCYCDEHEEWSTFYIACHGPYRDAGVECK